MKCTCLFMSPGVTTTLHVNMIFWFWSIILCCFSVRCTKKKDYWTTENDKNKESVLFHTLLSTQNKSFWLQLPNALPWRWFRSMWNTNIERKASSCSHGFSNPCISILKWLFWVFPPRVARFESYARQVLMQGWFHIQLQHKKNARRV